jgi:hypothetical protein
LTTRTDPTETRPRRRAGGAAGGLLALALAVAACSSDPSNPLGRDLVDDILGSRPGVVFQDTLDVLADTVLAYYTLIAADPLLDLGRIDGYEYTMIVRPSMEGASADTGRTVASAELRIVMAENLQQMPARFYTLGTPYSEGDSVAALDTLSVILDETGSADRNIEPADALYWIPPGLVQGWIRGDTLNPNNGIAIVYNDAVNDRLARFHSRSAPTSRATLQVTFTDTTKTYDIAHDATYIRPTATTSNLVVSDGFVRRTHFRLGLDALPDSAAVHSARVRFHLVDGTANVGTNPTVVLYAPQSDDPASAAFLEERLVTTVSVDESSGVLDMSVTNALLLTLEGQIADYGFVLRFDLENTELRQVEFYGSQAADSLRPRVFVTVSTPAEFDR